MGFMLNNGCKFARWCCGDNLAGCLSHSRVRNYLAQAQEQVFTALIQLADGCGSGVGAEEPGFETPIHLLFISAPGETPDFPAVFGGMESGSVVTLIEDYTNRQEESARKKGFTLPIRLRLD